MRQQNVVRMLCFSCHDHNMLTISALVGSLTIGTTFFLSFLVGMLADKIGLRLTAVIGGALATLGMALSAVGYKHIEVLYVTYGIMFGTGSSLVYTPSLTILGHYFRKKLGVVNGIVTAGSSLFTIGLSFINQYILENHGVGHSYFLIHVLSFLIPTALAVSTDVRRLVISPHPLCPHLHSRTSLHHPACQGEKDFKTDGGCREVGVS